MFKRKNIYVISVSAVIILLVIVSSFLGFIVYFQWRQLNLSYSHYETQERLDTISYVKNVEISSLKIIGGFNRLPMIEGRFKNKEKSNISSITLKINFLDNLNKSVYEHTIYILELPQPPIFFGRKIENSAFLRESGGIISFRYILWGCPKKFIKMFRKESFSDKPGEWSGKISGEILHLKLR